MRGGRGVARADNETTRACASPRARRAHRMTSSSFSISLRCPATSCRRQCSTAAAHESRRRLLSLSPSSLFDDCCRSRRCVVRSRCAALSSQATAASRTFCALAWNPLAVRPGIGPCASGMTVSPGPGMSLCELVSEVAASPPRVPHEGFGPFPFELAGVGRRKL